MEALYIALAVVSSGIAFSSSEALSPVSGPESGGRRRWLAIRLVAIVAMLLFAGGSSQLFDEDGELSGAEIALTTLATIVPGFVLAVYFRFLLGPDDETAGADRPD